MATTLKGSHRINSPTSGRTGKVSKSSLKEFTTGELEMRIMRVMVIFLSFVPLFVPPVYAESINTGGQISLIIINLVIAILGFFIYRIIDQNDRQHKEMLDEIKSIREEQLKLQRNFDKHTFESELKGRANV